MPIASRRRFSIPRFTVRTLLVVVTAICVFLGATMYWYRTNKAEFQRELAISTGLTALVIWESHSPDWYSQLFPDSKIFLRVREIKCFASGNVGGALDAVEQLPQLHAFTIESGNSITPTTRERIARLQRIYPDLLVEMDQ